MTVENPVPQGEVLQLTPYNAKYDAGPTLLPDHMSKKVEEKEIRTMFSDTFKSLIDADLPRLLTMKTVPSEITAEDVKTWLGSTLMRYQEEPSEVPLATIATLHEKVSQLRPDDKNAFLDDLINTLKMPWGFDEFGKQQELRRIWEQEVASALKTKGIPGAVANSVHKLGGFFVLGGTINQIGGFVDMLSLTSEIGTAGKELSGVNPDVFKNWVEQCDTYVDRVELLKEYRAKLLSFLQEYINSVLAVQNKERARMNAELNDMLKSLGRRPSENTDAAEAPPDIP